MERRHRISITTRSVRGYYNISPFHEYHLIRIYKGIASVDNHNSTVPEYTIKQDWNGIPIVTNGYHSTWFNVTMKPSDSSLLGLVLHVFKVKKVGEIRAA